MRRFATIAVLTLPFLTLGARLRAQSLPPSVTVGNVPVSIAVNPITNKIYVANQRDNTVSVIDGATNTVDGTITLSGTSAVAVAVDPSTNKIFAISSATGAGTLSEIQGGSFTVAKSASVGTSPSAIAVNSVTGMVYVACAGTNQVSIADEATLTVTNVTVGTAPEALAVNPVTNKVYVANTFGSSVTVIDSNNTASSPITVGTQPSAIAVNPATNTIYVANTGSQTISVIAGATATVSTTISLSVGGGPAISPSDIAVNPATNQICVAGGQTLSPFANFFMVIDGSTNSITGSGTTGSTRGIALDPITDFFFVSVASTNQVLVVPGVVGFSSTSVSAGAAPGAIAVNPVTDIVYVANSSGNTVTVLDASANIRNNFAVGTGPNAVVTNPITNKIYVTNFTSNDVTVIDRADKTIATVPVGTSPNAVDVNLNTNKIYVSNSGSNSVSVIDGSTDTVADTVSVGLNPVAVAVNPVTNKIYVANRDSASVAVIDGTVTYNGGSATTTISVGSTDVALAVNPATNKIYVADQNVTVIDGATNITTTIPAGTSPVALAVNPITNKIYVAHEGDNTVSVIDGPTQAVTATVTDTSLTNGRVNPVVAVNPNTNKIYVTNQGDNSVTVIDGATDTLATTIGTGTGPDALAVNTLTNKVYVANGSSNNVTVINGVINSTTTTLSDPAATDPIAVAVMIGENKTYIVNNVTNNVTSFKEQQIQPVPLTATITPLTGNATTSTTPSITFTASSTFSPNATTPNNLLFQVDGWQGPWTAATNNGSGNFSATLPTLQYGIHALFAYATDGQDATVAAAGGYASSPLIGNIVGYGFLVAPVAAPAFSASPSPLAFGSVADFTTSAALTLTVTNTGNASLTVSNFSLAGTNAADFTVASDACTGATVSPAGTCTVGLTFTPSIAGAESATLTFTDNAADSPQTVNLTGTGLAAPMVSLSPTGLVFSGQVIGTSSPLQVVTLTNTGTASLTITALAPSIADFGVALPNTPGPPACQLILNTPLAANSSCRIPVVFTPSTLGLISGTLSIQDNASNSPQLISLSGTGFSAGVPSGSISGSTITSVAFGPQPVGTSTSQTVTIANTGTGQLGSISVSVTDPQAIPCNTGAFPNCNPQTDGSLPYQFTQTNNCPTSLAMGATCTITVTYRALTLGTVAGTPGPVSGTLVIANDGATNPLNITLTGTASPVPFANGEVFLGVSNGKIQRRSASGQLIQVIDAGVTQDIAGMAFDSAGNLYATAFQDLKIQKFDGSGNLVGTFADFSALGLTGEPESILFDKAGNVYVGAPDSKNIYKFDSNGNLLTNYSVAVENRGTDWIEMASDQCTIYYTSEGVSILRYNVCTNTQLANFTSSLTGSSAYALRIRPNGEVLVADSVNVTRLDSSANTLQTYSSLGSGYLFGLNLDPDGTSFWTADTVGTQVYKIDLASGNQLVQYTVASPDVGGITVKGEINVATSPAVTISPTALTLPDTPVGLTCYRTLTVTNTGNGPLTISGLATSDSTMFPIPANSTATPNTCQLGTVAAGASCQVTVGFHPATQATLTGTLTITSNAPGSPHTVSLTGTGKPACPLAAAQASERVLRGTNQTTFTVHPNATCQATDQIKLACVNAQPATCAFSPGTIQNPQQSLLTMANLRAVGDSIKQFEVTGTSADFIQRTLYLQVMFADFSFTKYPNQARVAAGGTASYALSIVPVNGLAGQVALTCAGAPAGGSCTVTPSSVNISNDTVVQVQVKVQTSSGGVAPLGMPSPDSQLPYFMWVLAAVLMVAGLAAKRRAQAARCAPRLLYARLAMGLALLMAVGAWGSCGGGGTMPLGTNRSLAGTYTIRVTGTLAPSTATGIISDPSAPPLAHQTDLTLTVE